MTKPIRKSGAKSSAGEPLEFIMSTGGEDRVGDIIEQDGWDLRSFKKNPVAFYGHDASRPPIGKWTKVRVEGGKLRGVLSLAEKGTNPFVDTVHSLIEQDIIRAVSVGFAPIEYEPIPDSKKFGIRFKKQTLLECSLVGVPANGDALRIAKDLSDEMRVRLFAKPGEDDGRSALVATIAKSGARQSNKGTTTMSLAERIQAKQNELIAFKDTLSPLTKKVDEGEELTDEETTEFDRVSEEIEGAEKALTRLRTAEKHMGLAAAARAETTAIAIPSIVQGKHVGSGLRAGERPMDLLLKMAVVHLIAHMTREPLEAIRAKRYPSDERVDAMTKHFVSKATSVIATTTNPGWAAELVQTAVADFIEAFGPTSVYRALSARGLKMSFDGAGAIKIPRRNPGAGGPGDLRGAFVGEGQPIPVRQGSFGAVTLLPHKMGVISTFSREIMQRSNPTIESMIRQGITEDTSIAIDVALLDAVAANANRPAGLLNGVTPIAASTAGGIAAIVADMSAALAPFTAANAANGLVWLLNPSLALMLQFASTPLGTTPFKEGADANTLGGIGFIASTNIPADKLLLVRASDFASASGDEPEFDTSDTATLHMDDGGYPVDQQMNPGTVLPINAGTPAVPTRSLWQTASVGIRMLLDMSWAMRRAGMISVVNGVDWANPTTP